jgi:hypothetical protein
MENMKEGHLSSGRDIEDKEKKHDLMVRLCASPVTSEQ